MAGKGQERQPKKQVGLQLPQGINLFLALLFLLFFILCQSEEIKVARFHIYALHFLAVQEASTLRTDEDTVPLLTVYIESPLVSRKGGCQSKDMPEAWAEGCQLHWES